MVKYLPLSEQFILPKGFTLRSATRVSKNHAYQPGTMHQTKKNWTKQKITQFTAQTCRTARLTVQSCTVSQKQQLEITKSTYENFCNSWKLRKKCFNRGNRQHFHSRRFRRNWTTRSAVSRGGGAGGSKAWRRDPSLTPRRIIWLIRFPLHAPNGGVVK